MMIIIIERIIKLAKKHAVIIIPKLICKRIYETTTLNTVTRERLHNHGHCWTVGFIHENHSPK